MSEVEIFMTDEGEVIIEFNGWHGMGCKETFEELVKKLKTRFGIPRSMFQMVLKDEAKETTSQYKKQVQMQRQAVSQRR